MLLTAAAAKSVLDNVINTSGIIEATSVANVNGKIVLVASGGGTDGERHARCVGQGRGQSGGTVEVLGDSVTLGAGRADRRVGRRGRRHRARRRQFPWRRARAERAATTVSRAPRSTPMRSQPAMAATSRCGRTATRCSTARSPRAGGADGGNGGICRDLGRSALRSRPAPSTRLAPRTARPAPGCSIRSTSLSRRAAAARSLRA